MISKIEKSLNSINSSKPLILCLTNLVTADFVANSLLSIGAAPIVSVHEDELEELIKIASAVYINIGTIDHKFVALVKKALESAKKFNKPIVFDPVGCGATVVRTDNSKYILPFAKFIRGNSSEIIALTKYSNSTYGVEATHSTEEASSSAKLLSSENKSIVMVSGPSDFITDGKRTGNVPFGSPLMQKVTGMGCSLTAVIGAFMCVNEDYFEAGLMAANYFGLCGEIASNKYSDAGSFKVAFLDQLHNPNFLLMADLYEHKNYKRY